MGMKVLIADDEPGPRDSLQDLVGQNQNVQVSGVAVEADNSPECVVARELRRILDGCPICQAGFRDHSYCVLATMVMNQKPDCVARLAQFLQCIRDSPRTDLLASPQLHASAHATPPLPLPVV